MFNECLYLIKLSKQTNARKVLLSYRNHLNGHLGQVRRTTGFTKVAATET